MRSGLAAFASLAFAVLGSTLPGAARSGLKVLVATSVTDQAAPTMSPELWAKYVAAYVGGQTIVFPGPGAPTLDDCHKAGADYVVVAPFDLRPRLPGLPNSTGRIAAMSHLVVTNCITNTISIDRTIDFDSDPPSSANDGDFESVPEITWAHDVPATLAKFPIVSQRIAHVLQVQPPFALVDVRANGLVHPGDALRDFATSDHKPRATPIIMTVTQVYDSYVEVTFAQTGPLPDKGDLVEPLPKGAPGT